MSELKAFPVNVSGDVQTSLTMGTKDLLSRFQGTPISLENPQDHMDLYVAFDDFGLSPSSQERAIGTVERITDIVKRTTSLNRRRFWLPDSMVVLTEQEDNQADINGLGVVASLSSAIVTLKGEGAKRAQNWEIGPDKLLIVAGKGDVRVKSPTGNNVGRRSTTKKSAEALVLAGKVARI